MKREVPSTVDAIARYGTTDEALMDRVQGTADLGDVVVETEMLGHFDKPFPRAAG